MVVVYFCPDWFQQRRAEKTEEGLVTGADKANSNNKLPLRQSAGRKFLRLSVVVFLLSSFATVAEQDGDGEGNSTKHTGHQPIVGRRLLGQNAPASQIHVLSHHIQLPTAATYRSRSYMYVLRTVHTPSNVLYFILTHLRHHSNVDFVLFSILLRLVWCPDFHLYKKKTTPESPHFPPLPLRLLHETMIPPPMCYIYPHWRGGPHQQIQPMFLVKGMVTFVVPATLIEAGVCAQII